MGMKHLLYTIITALCVVFSFYTALSAGVNKDAFNGIIDCDLAKVKAAVGKGADLLVPGYIRPLVS